MKKIFYSLCVLSFAPLFSIGQITIISADMPQVGDVIIRYTDTLATVTEGNAGANQTWIMTGATKTLTDTTKVLAASATPYANSFPSANVATTTDNASFAYYNMNSDSLENVGFAGDLIGDGSIITAPFNSSILVNRFPRTYTTLLTDTYGMDVTASGTSFGIYQIRIKRSATINENTDGWGKLTTPDGTYDALRIKHDEYTLDSLWIKISPLTPFSFYQEVMDTAISYLWLAKGQGLPVAELTVDLSDEPLQFTWKKEVTQGIQNELSDIIQLQVFPNPTKETLWLKVGKKAQNEAYNFDIYDMQGQLVQSEKVYLEANNATAIDLKSLAAGMYSWKISNPELNQASSGRFTLVK